MKNNSYKILKESGLVILAAAFLVSGFFVANNAKAAISSINLIMPGMSSGEIYRGTIQIKWNALEAVSGDLVDIVYSTDNFTNKTYLTVAGVDATTIGEFDWNTMAEAHPAADGNNYKIQISSRTTPSVFNNSTYSFTIDNTPPTTTYTISPTSPDGTDGWYKTKPTIMLSCADQVGLSGCDKTYYSWDGSSFSEGTSITNAPEGQDTLSYYSTDKAGNQEGTKTLDIKVDTQAPTISSYTLNGNVADAFFNPATSTVTISLAANEPVDWLSAQIYNATDPTIYKEKLPSGDGTATTTFAWDGAGGWTSAGTLVDGIYKIKVHIKDMAGNETTVDPLLCAITVDNTNPTITEPTSPVAEMVYKTNPTLTFTATDSGTTVSCTYKIDSGSPVSVLCTGEAITGLSDGRHSVVVTATDAAGNSVSSGPISFVYDNNNTLTVGATNADFTTIQVAINKATTGDTINVAAGTYTEVDQIVIDKNLSIIGADKTTTIIKPAQDTTNIGHADSSAWVLVNSNKIFNLNNITLDGSGKLIAVGILSHGHGTIDNNIFTNIAYNQSGPDYKGIAIELYGSDMTVSNNSLSNIGRIGVFNGNGTNSIISGNTYVGKDVGNFLDYGFEVGRNGHATISNNTISNNLGVATVDGSTSAGILVTSYFNPETPSGATITGNTITNSTDGIAVGYDASDASVVVAHNNKLSGNTTGINSTHPTVDAINNWWGTAYKPTIQTEIVGNVTFEPYYVDAAMITLSDQTVNTINVDASYTDGSAGGHIFGYDAFAKIQDGVDKIAPSGTVNVAGGTYTENVNVNKPLMLQGEGAVAGIIVSGLVTVGSGNVTIQNLTLTNPTGNYAVSIGGFGNVTITGNTVINVGTSATGNVHAIDWQDGVSDAVNLTITHNTISNIGNTTTAGSTSGIGILDSTGTAILTDVLIDNNSISNIKARAAKGAYGIILNHANNLATGAVSGATISNNTINDLTGGWATAIGLEGNTPNARVKHNTISNLVSAASLGVHIEDNGFAGTITIIYNQFANGLNVGVLNSMTTDVNAEENWWGAISGPYHSPKNTLGTGNAVSDHVTYSPFCLDVPSGNPLDCSLGSSDPLDHFDVNPSAASSVVGTPITLTVTAKDADNITRVNDISKVSMAADNGAAFGSLLLTLVSGAETTTVNNSVTGTVNVSAIKVGDTITGTTSVEFIGSDLVAPTVRSQTPTNGSTDVAINISPTITFSEAMDANTVNNNTVKLRLYSDDSVISSVVSLNDDRTVVTIDPVSNLLNSTDYYIWVSGAKDLAGNTVVAYTDKVNQKVTTGAESVTLAVTGISAAPSPATADNSFENGWHWTFNVMVPTVESSLSMQFSDWTGSAGVIPVANNTRFYSAQSDHADAANAVTITTANTYTGPIILNSDLDPSTPGRQIQITVETKVPAGSAGGSYSASYGIRTTTP